MRPFPPRPGRLRRAPLLSLVAALLSSIPSLPAQEPGGAADDDWLRLQSRLARDPAHPVSAARTPDQRAAALQARIIRLRQAADEARDFQVRHATSPYASRARRLELLSRLEAARFSPATEVTSALALAAAFRADRTQLREHRFEVALAAERLRLRTDGPPPPAGDEVLAGVLRREFGAIPEVHGLLAGLAARAGMETANRLATQLLELRPPPALRAAAEAITARYGLVGHPLALRLRRLDATTFELPERPAANGPTVIYVWTPGHPPATGGLAALRVPPSRLPPDVRWIFLGLGVTTAAAREAAARAPFAGTHCQDSGGPLSPVAARLNVTTSPLVFVLNRQGVLTGYGRVDELPDLLAAAGRG